MSKYQYYYPQNTEEGEKLSLGSDQSSGGAILSCLWFERPLLHAVYMIAYQTRFTPAQAYNRLWSTRPPSCPAQNNSRHGEVLTATALPLLAISHKGFHREAVPEGPFWLQPAIKQCGWPRGLGSHTLVPWMNATVSFEPSLQATQPLAIGTENERGFTCLRLCLSEQSSWRPASWSTHIPSQFKGLLSILGYNCFPERVGIQRKASATLPWKVEGENQYGHSA